MSAYANPNLTIPEATLSIIGRGHEPVGVSDDVMASSLSNHKYAQMVRGTSHENLAIPKIALAQASPKTMMAEGMAPQKFSFKEVTIGKGMTNG